MAAAGCGSATPGPLRVAMFVASAPFPIGGTTALFEFADGLARRGHQVTLAHTSFEQGLTPLEQIWWHRFDASVAHCFDREPPAGDVVLGFDGDLRPHLGRPLMWVQARYILLPELEDRIYAARCPKLCTSTWLRDLVERDGVGPAHLVPYGMRHDKWQSDIPWREREPLVTMLYNPHPTKGGSIGVAAMLQVRQQRPDVRCVVFGATPWEPPVGSGIEFLHNPPQEVLVQLLAGARVFVQSSVWEGFGLTCIEAMACGAALVTTSCGGSADYASDDTAFVVPPFDPEVLAASILTALDEGEARASEGQRFVQQFDWDRSAEVLEHVLVQTISSPA